MTFDLVVKIIQNLAQYPQHHVTYVATKFEVATSVKEEINLKFVIHSLKNNSKICCI